MTTIAERFKSARLRRAISQEQLAKSAGVSEATINRIERGLLDTPRFVTLHKVAPVLGVEPGWLLTGEGAES